MDKFQYTLLRHYVSRLLGCAPSRVACHWVDFDISTNIIPNTQSPTSYFFVTSLTCNTNTQVMGATLQLLYKNKIVFEVNKESSPFHGVAHLNCLVTSLSKMNMTDNVSIAGYRFYNMDEGTNYLD